MLFYWNGIVFMVQISCTFISSAMYIQWISYCVINMVAHSTKSYDMNHQSLRTEAIPKYDLVSMLIQCVFYHFDSFHWIVASHILCVAYQLVIEESIIPKWSHYISVDFTIYQVLFFRTYIYLYIICSINYHHMC